MGVTDNYLTILDAGLVKKIDILNQLIDISDEQKKIIEAENFDDTAFDETTTRKGELIERLMGLDNGFQALFDNVKDTVEGRRGHYAREIRGLQDKISTITELSSRLQSMERVNKELVSKRFSVLHKEASQAKTNRQKAANYYKTMNRITDEPVFMDKKK